MRVYCSILVFFLSLAAGAQNAFVATYGMAGSFNEGKGIVALADSTYILLGNRQNLAGESSAWLFKVDSLGSIIWEKYFTDYNLSSAENLSRHDDTSVVLSGTVLIGSDYSMLVARVGSSGTILWEKVYGTDAWDQGLCSASDKYGNVYLTGYGQALDTFDQDILLWKLDGNTGDSLFAKRIDDGFNDKAVYIDTASGDNLIMASQSFNNSNDPVKSRIWRFDLNLDTIWTSVAGFNDTSASIRLIDCLFEDTLLRIVYGGQLLPDTGVAYRIWYGSVSSSGTFVFEHIIQPYYMTNARRGLVDGLNKYYFTGGIFPYYFGFGNSDIGFWRDSAGWVNYQFYGAVHDETGMDLDFAADGGMVFIGTTKNYGPGVNNIMLVKVGPDYVYNDTNPIHYTPAIACEKPTAKLYPNPCRGDFRIDVPDEDQFVLEVFDLQGKLVNSANYYSGETYTLKGFRDGMYLIKITSESQSYNFRLLLQQE